MFKKHIFLFSK